MLSEQEAPRTDSFRTMPYKERFFALKVDGR